MLNNVKTLELNENALNNVSGCGWEVSSGDWFDPYELDRKVEFDWEEIFEKIGEFCWDITLPGIVVNTYNKIAGKDKKDEDED